MDVSNEDYCINDEADSSTIILQHCQAIENGNNIKKGNTKYKIVFNKIRSTNRHKNPSGVWKYFALATKEGSELANSISDPDGDRILCMLCYFKGRVHVYKSRTSSSNLWKHLQRRHNIELPSEKLLSVSSLNFDGFELSSALEEHMLEDNLPEIQLQDFDADVPDDMDFENAGNIISTMWGDEEITNDDDISVKYEEVEENQTIASCIEQQSENSLEEPPTKKYHSNDLSLIYKQNDEFDGNEPECLPGDVLDNIVTVDYKRDPGSDLSTLEDMSRSVENLNHQNEIQSQENLASSILAVEQMDEIDLFGKLITKKLRQVPKERLNLIEIKIMQVILENT